VCYENLVGNYQISHIHLQNGLRIITRECHKQRDSQSTIPKDIVQVFRRLDVQAISITDFKVPYPDHACKEPIELLSVLPPTGYDSIEESIDFVLHLCRWLFRRAAASDSRPITQEDLIYTYKAVERWTLEIDRYFTAPNLRMKEQLPSPIGLLKMYQIIVTIIIATGVHSREMLHDDYLHKYQEVVALGEAMISVGQVSGLTSSANQFFCFDIGVIFPLFWAATKCRDSHTRRRALKLLSSVNHQEGAWKSSSAAKVAEFVIAVEEKGMSAGSGHIPETARVHLVNMKADTESGEIHVSCLLRSERDDSWCTREGQIQYPTEFWPA
jgi:hypothetical protein